MSVSLQQEAQSSGSPTDATGARLTADEILRAFENRIHPVKTSFFYQAGLFFVVITMIIVPIIYLGIIGAVGYAGYLHAVDNRSIITEGLGSRGHDIRGVLILYIGPLFACLVLLLFMIKPLFARPVRVTNAVELSETDQPLLFAFVRRLSDALRAPMPRTIRVDCDVNASAAFRDGFTGFLRGDLVLTIGMPLVAGLNLRQLAGVLAHELGHFSQQGGMRMTFLAISISNWLARVVYERDVWDERLKEASQGGWGWITVIVMLTRLLIWLTRRILWLLMVISRLLTFFMFRQMEFNADMHEIRLAGSTAFESTALRLRFLNASFEATLNELGSMWQERRLTDDLPDAVASNLENMPKEVKHALMQEVTEGSAGFFSTHPSDARRIAAARREGALGVYKLEAPARVLFRNYRQLALDSSTMVYHAILGTEFTQAQLVSSKELTEHRRAFANDVESVPLLCGDLWRVTCPMVGPQRVKQETREVQALIQELQSIHQQILTALPSVRQAVERHDSARRRKENCTAALVLLDAGFTLPKEPFGLPSNTRDGVTRFNSDAQDRLNSAAEEIITMGTLLERRVVTSMALLQDPEIGSKAAVVPGELEKMLMTFRALRSAVDDVNMMRSNLVKVHVLMQELETNHTDEAKAKLVSVLLEVARHCNRCLQNVRDGLGQHDYPLPHGKPGLTIGRYLTNETLPETEQQMVEGAAQAIESFDTLYTRVAGQLGRMTASVETAAGLSPPCLNTK